jgi:hypothetical protein
MSVDKNWEGQVSVGKMVFDQKTWKGQRIGKLESF